MKQSEDKTLLVISQVYVPDPASVGQHMADAAAEMVRRGWRVKVIAASRGYDDPSLKYKKREVIDGVEVRRVPLSSFGKGSIILRLIAGTIFMAQCIVHGLLTRRVSCILVSTSPPMCSIAAIVLGFFKRAPIKYWVMDLNPDQMIELGKITEHSIPARAFNWLNRRILGYATDVVALDRFMADRLNRKHDVTDKMSIMPPWPHEDHLEVVRHDDNPFRNEHDLNEKFVIMYSGNHGFSTPVTTVLNAALKMQDREDLLFMFIGGGVGKKEVDEEIAREKPRNIRSLPYQPLSALRYSLSAADVHLVSVGNDVVGVVHPCKVYGAMAVARPILLLGPDPCHVSDIIREHNIGWQITHGDVNGAIATIDRIRQMPAEELREMGERARRLTNERFSKRELLGRFCDVLESETSQRRNVESCGSGGREPIADSTMPSLTKYVFIQNDPFYLPKVLDKYLREFADSTAGVNIQSVAQGKRTVVQTALELYRLYGFRYFQWKLRKYLVRKLQSKFINDWLGSTKTCYSVRAVAKKYGVPVTEAIDVNSEAFLAHLREQGVKFIVSISGTQLYRKALREQTEHGIVNCHGAMLPKYRGLMPSFWTLANGETVGGVSVHYVDAKLDNGPILVQKSYRIHPHDTLEDVMARSKDLAAEAIIECVRLVEAGEPILIANDESQATHFSMPKREDVKRFLANGHRFY